MGLRTAAAKLGFRFASATSNKKIWSSSRLLLDSRRWIASVAETTDIPEKKTSNLYLFFREREQQLYSKQKHSSLVVRPIRLDSYEDVDEDNEEVLLEEEAQTFSSMDSSSCSIRLGSQILFATDRRDICWVDLLTHPLNIHVSSPTESKIKSFLTPKYRMMWGAIDHQLYCVQNCFDPCEGSINKPAIGVPFEVLDTENNNAKWQPLSEPPFIHMLSRHDRRDHMVLFLNESKKILGWESNKDGVFCFDTKKPENGWIESPPSLSDSLPFNIASKSSHLVVGEHHPKIGKFNLLFAYDCLNEPFLVYPFFISDNCDSCQAIDQLIRLPKELCSEYRIGYCDTEPLPVSKRKKCETNISFQSQILHLGAKKFCLILHKFYENDDSTRERSEGFILVITYEYDIVVKDEIIDDSKPNLKIKTRRLGTRRFKYCLKKNNTATHNDLNGAFVSCMQDSS